MVRADYRPASDRCCQVLARIVKGAVPSYSSRVVVKTNSQGGVKVPTGGNRILVFQICVARGRSWSFPQGVIRGTADSVRFRGRQLKSGYENEIGIDPIGLVHAILVCPVVEPKH